MRRVLITGSRNITDGTHVWAVLDEELNTFGEITLVQGDCPTGADAAAVAWSMSTDGVYLESHPADWSLGKKAGPLRNQVMVDLGADVCHAFPLPDSRGTYDCMRRAEAAGIPVIVHQEVSS